MNINANPIGQDRYGSRIAINLISRSQRSPRSSGINRKRERERVVERRMFPRRSGKVSIVRAKCKPRSALFYQGHVVIEAPYCAEVARRK